jgi:nucleoid-associated protein YgaU
MTRINALRNIELSRSCVAWGKNAGALVFAAVLVICSVTVGCSSDKPKVVSSISPIPAPQTPVEATPAPAPQPAAKPASKKVVRKKPATVNYADKTYGVTFEYPRRYAIETGDAATELLVSSPMPMNFIQPGGVALAAVELPETGFANTDFSSAFFDVSVHKGLTADQCTEFAVPQPKNVAVASNGNEPASSTQNTPAPTDNAQTASSQTPASASTDAASTQAAKPSASTDTSATQPTTTATASTTAATTSTTPSQSEALGSKLMLGDLELRGTEAVTGEGTRQSDSKYFHVYQNGACYEFAMNVTTVASDQGITRHVDRDKVFNRLESILSTVKIAAVAPEATADAPKSAVTPVTAASPAQ